MTYWKVDLLNPALGVPKTQWFRNSHDAEQFCYRIPCSPYATSYYCREVRLPDQALDAARRGALKRVNATKALPAPEKAEEGEEYVVPLTRGTGNLRTHVLRIIQKAGVRVWPKPFQNLRASREN